MTDDFEISPIDRKRTGPRNEFVFRCHSHHELAVRAIRRRQHPLWSQMREEVRAA